MKHYLDLARLSAQARRRQDRMSVFCIALAVFLVTVIFGMADMFIRSQLLQARQEYGDWHIAVRDIPDETAALLAARPEVAVAARYGVLNYHGEDGYTLAGKQAILCGAEEAYLAALFPGTLTEGRFPQTDGEALVSENARRALGLAQGSSVTLQTPDGGAHTFTVCGFVQDTAKTAGEDAYALFLCLPAFRALAPAGSDLLYVQFAGTAGIPERIAALKHQLGLADAQVSENTKLLGLLGQSSTSLMRSIYEAAAVLFVLVLLAGVLMIASSLNSNVAQRTEFFGMLRCIGATPRQVTRLVRREALGWCRRAIPAGTAAGVAVIWALCAVLRFLSPAYFGAMPALGVSLPSIAAGAGLGLLTVLLAAQIPARKAARVSPLAAARGSVPSAAPARRAAGAGRLRVETALGLHHAVASRANFLLTAGSFAFSVLLFLAFAATLDFMGHAITPLDPWTPDVSILSADSSCAVEPDVLDALRASPAVRRAYGRQYAYDLPAQVNGTACTADLLTYEEQQFRWAQQKLLDGSVDAVQSQPGTVLLVYGPQTRARTGDVFTVELAGRRVPLTVAGVVSDCPFNNVGDREKLICSEQTFRLLTGEDRYTIVDVQLRAGAADADVEALRALAGAHAFRDERLSNRSARGTYYSFALFLYGFLVLIALIAVFNIVNRTALSVAARKKQYGALRAIGLSGRQLARMVITEAAAYAAVGSALGGLAGLALNRLLFGLLVTANWGEPWQPPLAELGIILAVVAAAVALAVRGPLRALRRLSIAQTVSEL